MDEAIQNTIHFVFERWRAWEENWSNDARSVIERVKEQSTRPENDALDILVQREKALGNLKRSVAEMETSNAVIKMLARAQAAGNDTDALDFVNQAMQLLQKMGGAAGGSHSQHH